MSLEKVKDILIDLDIDNIQSAVQTALEDNTPEKILETLSNAMLEVGKLYEEEEYFLPELVLAGETMEEGLQILRPHLVTSNVKKKGKVVAATVKGDLHDIGKNIVVVLLSAAGYDVIDLGRDVSAKDIVDKAKEVDADIIAVSALLTMTSVEIEKVVKELIAQGIRDKIKVICGGAPLNQELAEKFGADISCDDAVTGIEVCDKIMAEKA